MDDILDVETGGLLEIWAELYGITKEENYLTLMERYYRGRLFDPILAGEDVLTNMHANTTIPEILGAAAAYEVTGEIKWLDIVKNYWKLAVSDRGQYCTGGQTCGEIWPPKKELAARLGDKNQEHCTVYNMMRLADFLLKVTGEKQYADYWEQNLYNGIFAQGHWESNISHGAKSKHPDMGLLAYFLPLRAGGRKPWSSQTGHFFCCHGTLVQANFSFNRGIYYSIEDEYSKGIAICQYFDSTLHYDIKGTKIHLEQWIDALNGRSFDSNLSTGIQAVNKITKENPHNPNVLKVVLFLNCDNPISFQLKIRIPWWIKGRPSVFIDDKMVQFVTKDGYVFLEQVWEHNALTIEFPKGINLWPLPDKPGITAFLYGPVVLAGLCKSENVLKLNPARPEETIIPDNEREWGSWMNTFRTSGQQTNIRFVPLYTIGYERYTVYFPIMTNINK
jgi:DUF1680 family protein